MSPPMPLFPVSPERAAGTVPPYSGPHSPSLESLRGTSPLRKHRRNDSDISVQGLAAMFENLEVKDFKEAQAKYLVAMQKERTKHAAEIAKLERTIQMNGRFKVRVEELEAEMKHLLKGHSGCVSREDHDDYRKQTRESIAKWENAFKRVEEHKLQWDAKYTKLNQNMEAARAKGHMYKKAMEDAKEEVATVKPQVVILKSKNDGLQKMLARVESDLKAQAAEAEKYKKENYILDVKVNTIETELEAKLQTLQDTLKLVEAERDALKTNLKEEEVLRIAAEGRIPLPTATTDEHDDFESPVRSPRKQHTPDRDEEDKENVAPKKAAIELKLAQQQLLAEQRLRERAQEQIEFMKMECQFRCCSCRIADSKGADFVHDNSYAEAMAAIKASVPTITPPPSDHGDEPMDVPMQDSFGADRPLTPPSDEGHSENRSMDQSLEATVVIERPSSTTPEPIVEFSPVSGTFRSVPSPVKNQKSVHIAAATNASLTLSAITDATSESVSESHNVPEPQPCADVKQEKQRKSNDIVIHEDAIMESDEEDELEPLSQETPAPMTPAQYLTRTITTTTTIPLHFSPATPAVKSGMQPMTPSTVAHAPAGARTPVLGELNLNTISIDREAALEAIRQRRGRARSMAMGQETPRKQMMEGVKERRDISAPVSRYRR